MCLDGLRKTTNLNQDSRRPGPNLTIPEVNSKPNRASDVVHVVILKTRARLRHSVTMTVMSASDDDRFRQRCSYRIMACRAFAMQLQRDKQS
jgi:hypothetical protein